MNKIGRNQTAEWVHYSDVIMGTMVSQITNFTIVSSTVYSSADQRKHQSSASLAFVRGIHRWPVNSPHKWPVTRKMFHLMTSSWPKKWAISIIPGMYRTRGAAGLRVGGLGTWHTQSYHRGMSFQCVNEMGLFSCFCRFFLCGMTNYPNIALGFWIQMRVNSTEYMTTNKTISKWWRNYKFHKESCLPLPSVETFVLRNPFSLQDNTYHSASRQP